MWYERFIFLFQVIAALSCDPVVMRLCSFSIGLQCEERARRLRAELAAEEHREMELNKILDDIVPEPKTPLVQRTRAVRKVILYFPV